MGLTGAHNLSTAAREALEEESTETVSGTLDGWVWSAAELTLIADDKGRIKVSVPMSLQERVAELNSERDTRVRTRLSVYRRIAKGTGDWVRTQYSLANITREEHPQLPDA